MESQAIDAATLAGSAAAIDLSLWGLILKSDLVVKLVLIVLLLASFWCWAIIVEKILRFRRLSGQADDFEESFWSGGSLEDLYDGMHGQAEHPLESLFASAMREWRRSSSRGLTGDDQLHAGITDRIGQIMQLTMNREMEVLERYLSFLATVGSTAPFIGLFGTVWGIMRCSASCCAYRATFCLVAATNPTARGARSGSGA